VRVTTAACRLQAAPAHLGQLKHRVGLASAASRRG